MTTHTPGYRCKQGVMGTWCHTCKAMLAAAPEMLELLKLSHDRPCFSNDKIMDCKGCALIDKIEGGAQ